MRKRTVRSSLGSASAGAFGSRVIVILLIAFALFANSGCYYGHLAVGQTRMLLARQPIESLLENPETPAELRRRLRGVEAVRSYARELGLEVGGQYTSYVAWPGDRVITTIVAARPGEVEALGFRFPFLGRLPYKGYFDREAAEAEAAELRSEDLDVCVVPVRAYSTLGWIDDPLTAPMLAGDDLELSETIFHELVHATAHLAGAADFNEGVATFIGQEAAYAYVAARGLPDDARSPAELALLQRERIRDARTLADEILRFQTEVAELYAQAKPEELADRTSPKRAALEAAARERIAALPLHSRDAFELAQALRLGDACLALRGTYAADLHLHGVLYQSLDHDLRAFVARLRAVIDSGSEEELRARFFGAELGAEPRSSTTAPD